jgi:hypothetical protein
MKAHRSTSWIRAAAAVATATLLLVAEAPSALATPTPPVSPLGPVFGAPPREPSPFSSADAFCTREPMPPGPPPLASATGVTTDGISVVALVPAATPSPGAGPIVDPAAEALAFTKLVNDCGGINGRRLDLHVVATTADPAGDCARATSELHPFAVVSWAGSDAAGCIAGPNRTVMIASGAVVPDTALLRTQGRLAVGATSRGVSRARLLELIASGRLDDKRIEIVVQPGGRRAALEMRRILGAADPSRKITVVATATDPTTASASAEVLITTSFDPGTARLTRDGKHPVAVYAFGNATDRALDAVRTDAGAAGAKRVSAAQVYGWITPALAQYRSGEGPTKFAQMCNEASISARIDPNAPSTTSTTAPTTSTAPLTLPDGGYARVTEICLAMRTLARALFAAGPNPTQPTLVRALYRLPYVDQSFAGPVPRPNQVVNEPVTRARQVVVLAQAQYPCVRPDQDDAAGPHMCWVPVAGWTQGHAVNARL